MISLAAFAGSLIGGVMPGLFAQRAGLTLESAAPYRYPLLIAAVMLIVGVVALFGMKDADGGMSSATLAPLPPRRT